MFVHSEPLFIFDRCGKHARFKTGKSWTCIPLCFLFSLIWCSLRCWGIYFVPALVALFRTHPQRGPVFILNLLLGWTGIGWAAALRWALRHFEPPAKKEINPEVEITQLILPCKPDYDFRAHGYHGSGDGDLLTGNS
jgi:hypothetical protein